MKSIYIEPITNPNDLVGSLGYSTGFREKYQTYRSTTDVVLDLDDGTEIRGVLFYGFLSFTESPKYYLFLDVNLCGDYQSDEPTEVIKADLRIRPVEVPNFSIYISADVVISGYSKKPYKQIITCYEI